MDEYLKLFYYINNVYIQLLFYHLVLFHVLLVSKVRVYTAVYRLQEFSFRERQVYTDLLAFYLNAFQYSDFVCISRNIKTRSYQLKRTR